MKLFRFGDSGDEDPGIELPGGERIDVSRAFEDFDEGFFASGGIASLREWVADGCAGCEAIPEGVRIGPPIARPSKIVCVGKNYADHAAEFDSEVPNEPVLFMKASSAFSGPQDPVVLPKGSRRSDYEVELAVVIGKTTSNVDEEVAPLHIAGYSVMGDYTERAFQKEMGGQWTKGKSCDSFAPMGPVLITRDEVGDPGNLRLWTKVNDQLRQNGYTSDMLFDIPYLISYISRFMTLLPGDVIATGTPAGVGMGMKPPQFLKAGDRVEMGCEIIGQFKQRVVGS